MRTKSHTEALKGYRLLEGLRHSSSAGGKRVTFTEEEVETIFLYFQGDIEAGDVPSASECKEFLDNHPMERSHKQVRDKIRNLLKVRKPKQ